MRDIALLIHKYLKDELEADENVELESWRGQSESNQRIFDKLTDDEYLVTAVADAYKIDSDELALQKLNLAIDAEEQGQSEDERMAKIRPIWPRLAVAAAILVLLAVSAVFILKKRDVNPGDEVAKMKIEKPDVAPGQYKAKLTLADGSTVLLDSFNKDQLIQQGNTVIRNKDGKLFYEQKGKAKEVLYNILTTGKGETFGTVLPDGSKVWLNSESSIRYPVSVTGDQQQIEVTGEAYFDIVHNPKRKLNIKVGDINIEDIGTQFNINAYRDEESIKTTLVEGSVKVRKGDKQVIVKSGQQAILSFDNPSTGFRVTKDVDVDAEVAWRFGYFNFNNADLKAIMRQLERWYDVEVVYKGNVDSDLELIGKMPRGMSLFNILKVLQTQQVHFQIEGKKIIVSR